MSYKDHLDMKVPLPEENRDKVLIPEMFIRQDYLPTGKTEINSKGERVAIMKKGWTIAPIKGNKSINKTRQISSRNKHPVLELKTAKVGSITESPHYIPRLADFPKEEDRYLIFQYLTHLHPTEEHTFPDNETRGLPPILPKNWRRKKLGDFPKGYEEPNYDSEEEAEHNEFMGYDKERRQQMKQKESDKLHQKIFGSDTESESDEEETPQKKGRGRLRKHKTSKEAYEAKIKSNKDKRAERRIQARQEKIKEKLEKGEKLTKKEKELHEAEGEGITPQSGDPCWEGYEMVGMKKKKDKNVPNCVPKGGTLTSSVAKGDEGIDFQDIKWGTFKALYDRFIKKNPEFKEHIEDLPHFADFVLENKDKFSKVAQKKALFMKNILENHK